MKIGVTGLIGSGKSLVGKTLRGQGLPVLDVDAKVHELYASCGELRQKISQAFGPESLTPEGVNRPLLANLIFANSAAREQLEQIVYPYLTEAVTAFLKEPGLRFVEASFFAKIPEVVALLDELWIVESPEEARLQRLVEHRGLTAEEATRRIASQRETPFPTGLPTRIIKNEGSREAFVNQILNFCKTL